MHEIFVAFDYISVFVMLACTVIVCTHKESRMQKLASLVSMTLLVCCVGFLIKAEASDAAELITGQKLVYSTVTHSMFLMLLFILQYCRYNIPKIVEFLFHALNLFVTVMVITLDHHGLFYKSYWAEDAGGYITLEKEYGPIHTVAVALFALYMVSALVVAVIFTVKNIRERSRYVWRLMVAVLLPCASYIIPKITGMNNDIQPVAFAAFTVMVIIMVYRDNIYDVGNMATEFIAKSMKDLIIVFDNNYSYKGCNDKALQVFPVLKDIGLDSDIRGKSNLITEILDGKMEEYELNNRIYSISIREIRDSFSVIGKVLWLSDVTVERNYLKLLESQKDTLENEVEELSEISMTDDMTGLENRRSYDTLLYELRDSDQYKNHVFIVFDINGLKHINDTIGHDAGDELIIAAAKAIDAAFGRYGKLFRIGGDEFIADITKYSGSSEYLSKLIDDQVKEVNKDRDNKLSISYGIVFASEYDEDVDEIIRIADKKMYEAKRKYYLENGIEMR